MIEQACRNLGAGESLQLPRKFCEQTWPPIQPRTLNHYSLRSGIRCQDQTVLIDYGETTEQLMQIEFGPSFTVKYLPDRESYGIARKNFSTEPNLTKLATSFIPDDDFDASYPLVEPVKPSEKMQETPLAQRFSNLDLD